MAGMFGLLTMGVMQPFESLTEEEQAKLKQTARGALAKGVNGGGGVTQVKMSTDQSGASGQNDYFAALGYNA